MTDLYAALNALRTDSYDVIRRKYRKAAKRAHPDVAGGSREKFATVSTALAVLTDPERRKYYDETGKIDRPGPDTRESKALEMAMAELTKVISLCDQRRIPIWEVDILGDTRKGLQQELLKTKAKMTEVEGHIKKAANLAPRFSAKKGKPNRITPLIEGWRADHERTLARGRAQIEMIKIAIGIIDDHEFKIDPRAW